MAVTRKSKRPEPPKDAPKKKKISKRASKKSVTETTTAERVSPKKRHVKPKRATVTDKKSKKKRRKSTVSKAAELNRGVVYFSNLPHGFYEKALKTYCSQFGVVTGVYIPRNANGNAKGFGFVEFKYPEVAEVVADTMNNYLMFKRLIKAKLVPLEEQKPYIFLNQKDSATLAREKKAVAHSARQRTLTADEEKAYKKRAEARVQRLKNKLKEKGVQYEFTVSS